RFVCQERVLTRARVAAALRKLSQHPQRYRTARGIREAALLCNVNGSWVEPVCAAGSLSCLARCGRMQKKARFAQPNARVGPAMARDHGQRSVYAYSGWEIDLPRREVGLRGAHVPLGGRAFDIVAVLVGSAGELVTKEQLLEQIWSGVFVEEIALRVHIAAI